MGEIEKTSDGKLAETAKELLAYRDNIISEVYNRPMLTTKNITLIEGLSEKRKKFDALWKEIEEKPDSAFENPFYKEATKIFVDQNMDIISSLEAKIRLRTAACVSDSKSHFINCLAEEGMSISDLDNLVEDYKESFRKDRELESWDIDFKKSADNGQEYMAQGMKFKQELDALATKIFKMPVNTELKIQYGENSSNYYFMHESNISFQPFVPELYSAIAHEGPFGHQIHEKLSEESYFPNHKDFRLTNEGLAMLGQKIALKAVYADSKVDVAEFIMSNDFKNIAFQAAIEKLVFYDRLDSDAVAERLAPTDVMKKVIKSTVREFDNDGLRIQRPKIVQYYAGFKKINQISGAARDVIMNNPNLNAVQKRDFLYEAIKRMYTGFRRPEIMKREIDLYLRRNKLIA